MAVAVVLGAAVAHADARLEARKHFKQGMALIADGRLDEGVDELLEAYSIKPHPNVLFNVAKAYESAGKLEDAITYYRRYLGYRPQDSAGVQAAIERLTARLPPPEPVPPEVVKKEPAAPSGPAVDPALVSRLEQLTLRLERATEALDAREKPDSRKGADPKADELPAPDDDTSDVPYEETVVTASRRAQSTLEAPNATTVITAEEIRASGAQNLPELLRRVPGAEVMAMGVSSYDLSFRGFNQRIANKVLLLVDGRTEYQDFLGGSIWPMVTIGLDEIERIEIIRGPGSALYGANAMLGVVNVITRSPGSGPRASFSGQAGNGAVAGGSALVSGGERVKYRASVGYTQAQKYSRDYDDGRPDVESSFRDSWLGLRSARGNLVLHTSFGRDVSVSMAGGLNRLFTEIYPIGLLRNFYFDGLGGYVQADGAFGPVKVKAFWNHLATDDAGPQYRVVGQRSLALTLQSNVFDAEALFQKDFTLLGQHRVGVGVSTRLKRLGWTYLGSLKQELHAAAFIQEEYHPIPAVQLLASYRIDRHPLLDNGQPGYAQSPRVSLLWRLAESQSVRASFATAFREPTFLESYMNLRTPLPGVNGASVLTLGDRTLKPERLLAFEVGWRGELPKLGLEYELTGYWNVVSDLIALSAVRPLPAGQAFDPDTQAYLLGYFNFQNDPLTYNARGLELGGRWSVLSGLDVRASAALQSISAAVAPGQSCDACRQAPAVKFFFGATYRTPVDVDLGADVAFTSGTTWSSREPDAADPTQIVNNPTSIGAYTVVNARVGYRLFKDKVALSVVGTHLGPTHAENPLGNAITRRVLATITVTP
ncbi:MAG: TonB-dependent receptor [Myxococcaceae bacterium]|nr:TonB-dependent receptor [Myxococcaceae bacterium]